MIARLSVAALILSSALLIACGGDDDTPSDSANPTSTFASATAAGSGDTEDEHELSESFIEGEWCSRQGSSSSGITYVFEDESFEYGVGDSLAPGGDLKTFRSSFTVVSVEEDEFVVEQLGQEITFTRGSCS